MGNALSGFLLSILLAGVLMAGDDFNEDYTLSMVGPESIFVGEQFEMGINFKNDGVASNGVQLGVCTENVNVTIVDIDDTGVDEFNTTFAAWTINPDDDDEERNWNAGFLMNVLAGAYILPMPGPYGDLWVCTYEYDDEVDEGSADTCDDDALDEVVFEFCDIGTPAVTTAVIAGGDQNPIREELTVCVVPEPQLLRGDCNDDGRVDIADAIFTLLEKNHDGEVGICQVACDVNGDGMHDNSDAIYTINYRFLDGPEPVDPFPDCGTSGDDTTLGCEDYVSCDESP